MLLVAMSIVVTFTIAFSIGQAKGLKEGSNNSPQPVRYADSHFPLINPLISISIPNATGFPELKSVHTKVQQIIDGAKKNGAVSEVGVYFRLPLNAHWFGINEDDKFDPGSLIKVPIMLAYLKEAEGSPNMLKERYRYDARNTDSLPNSLPPQLPSGTYSAAELIETMIVNSDNVAKDILAERLSGKALQDVFDETNTNFLQDPSGTISPKQYIIILSRIYSATYLDRYYSNYAMSLLTKTTFKDGLVSGLPPEVQVAHKYGERGVYVDNALTWVELHDCGLIYAEIPYYLCVMTKGENEASLAQTIRDISSLVYREREAFIPRN